MIDFRKYKYCFLETVYSNEDSSEKDIVLELVLSTADFKEIKFYRVTMLDAVDFYNQLVSAGVQTDFSFEDGYLQCGSGVKSRLLSNLTLIKSEIDSANSGKSFYDFIQIGKEGDFCIVDDIVLQEDNYCGRAVAKFSSIKFSQNTMTVYVHLFNEDCMYNKKLIYLQDAVLRFEDFYFAVPASNTTFSFPRCEYIKNCKINNKEYHIWKTDRLPIYDDDRFLISTCLINKAMCTREKNYAALLMMQRYKKLLLSTNNYEKSPVTWTGGTGSRTSMFGVTFKLSEPRMSEEDRELILRKCTIELPQQYSSLDEIKEYILKSNWTVFAKYAGLYLVTACSTPADSFAEEIANVEIIISHLETQILMSDLYLYRVRANSYVKGIHLVSPLEPRVFGGNESCFTIVEEGFDYGVI